MSERLGTRRSRRLYWLLPIAIVMVLLVLILLAAEGFMGEFNYGIL